MSTFSLNCLLGSGQTSTGVDIMCFLSSQMAAIHAGIHSNGMSFLKSHMIGAVIEENPEINM